MGMGVGTRGSGCLEGGEGGTERSGVTWGLVPQAYSVYLKESSAHCIRHSILP